jgi:hypothetical protein
VAPLVPLPLPLPAELARRPGPGQQAAELDAFDAPEAEATELFVDPFSCYGASPLQWAQLLEVAAAAAPGDPGTALERAGAAPGDGALLYLTPRQLALATAELEGMGEDVTSVQACASYLGSCLRRARAANARAPRR